MIAPCPHCSAVIEIDMETLSSLAGQTHFTCPACQGAVPARELRGTQAPNYQATGSNEVAPTSQTSHSLRAGFRFSTFPVFAMGLEFQFGEQFLDREFVMCGHGFQEAA
jgi:hypothetical protein